MSSAYTDVTFSNRQPDQPTAMKLNRLRDDLSAAIESIGGYYTDTWHWTNNTTSAPVGDVGINATSWSAATYLNISETSAGGVDKTVQMDRVTAVGNAILVKDAANAANYAEYTITGAGTDMGTYRQYPVTTTKYGGALPQNNANTTLTVFVQGATGGGGPPATGAMTFGEIPSGAINGTNQSYTAAHAFAAGRLSVFLNGLRQRPSADYNETSTTTFSFILAPLTGDTVSIDYQS